MRDSREVSLQEPQRWAPSQELRSHCSCWADGAGRQTSVIGGERVPVLRALSAGSVPPRRGARVRFPTALPQDLSSLGSYQSSRASGVRRRAGKAPTKTHRTGK